MFWDCVIRSSECYRLLASNNPQLGLIKLHSGSYYVVLMTSFTSLTTLPSARPNLLFPTGSFSDSVIWHPQRRDEGTRTRRRAVTTTRSEAKVLYFREIIVIISSTVPSSHCSLFVQPTCTPRIACSANGFKYKRRRCLGCMHWRVPALFGTYPNWSGAARTSAPHPQQQPVKAMVERHSLHRVSLSWKLHDIMLTLCL